MPNAEATAAITAAATRRSEARTSPLPRQATPKPANGFRGCMVRSTPLSSQRELLVSIGSTRLSHCPVRFRSSSGHRTTPLVIGALACHLAINSSLGLLLRRQASLPPPARRRRETKSPTASSASNLDHLVR